jgi:hypothetical protein
MAEAISYFSSLSNDQIVDIALQLNVADLSYYFLYNSRFNGVVCNNQWFWKQKFLFDREQPEDALIDDWKSLYKNYGSVYVFGSNLSGQLGLGKLKNMKGDTVDRLTPTKIPRFNVRTISACGYRTSAIDFNDDVWINLKILS